MDFTSYSFISLITLFYFGLFFIHKSFNNSLKPKLITDYTIYSSLILYGLWSPPSLIIILYVIITTLIFIRLFEQLRSKKIFVLSIITVILPLIAFKYTHFFFELMGIQTTQVNHWFLPLGISFYVFTAIALLSDVYTGKENNRLSIKQVVLLISYWPHLAAGPILRSKFISQHLFSFNFKEILPKALVLIAGGAAKKILIADNLGAYVNYNISQGIADMDALTALLTLIGFGGQIYADFSGYSEMAIGFSLLIGLKIPANFNYPYAAASIAGFWRKWHISLSTWFRDYVYIPLGGNRNNRYLSFINIIIVFAVSGLWHGASTGFLIWGLIHGILLIINRLYSQYVKINLGIFAWLLTFLSVNLAWSFFRLDVDSAILINKIIFTPANWLLFKLDTMYHVIPIIFMLFLLFADHFFKYYTVNKHMDIVIFSKRNKVKTYLYIWALFTIALFFSGKNLPFIYFEF